MSWCAGRRSSSSSTPPSTPTPTCSRGSATWTPAADRTTSPRAACGLRGDANGPVRVELLDTAYTFRAGHRIRLVLAGGSFPQFARSAGTGENPLTAAALVPNTHTVTEGTLTLPVA
ncbi:CocE/NonD family hydrolase C-terminal non-catalytic domain-containing protein [Microbacterium elymi]|uniref:CocE/NonD family hydrolase C-terminal non-catalytic domain-containing protein n=1 Tax=Microbacterium elymi TaxID=2909587 RepID=UPI00338E633F